MSCVLCDTDIRHGDTYDTSDRGDVHMPVCPAVCKVCRLRVDDADLDGDDRCVDCRPIYWACPTCGGQTYTTGTDVGGNCWPCEENR